MKRALLSIVGCLGILVFASANVFAQPLTTSVRSIDGSGYTDGNVGAAGRPLVRVAPADYPRTHTGDWIWSEPLVPNPRDLSNAIVRQTTFILNNRRLSDFVWAFGQFLDHDLDLTLNHPDNGTANIPINDPADPLGPNPIPFVRSDFDPLTGFHHTPRQQVNAITAFIDASNVYGSDAMRAFVLRTGQGGKLATSAGNLLPFNEFGLPNAGGDSPFLFLAGDVRTNEQVGLTAMHTLFVREHNRLADRLAGRYPRATDEEVYQLARKIVGAELQIITYNEFLPALLGPYAPTLEEYRGWDRTVDPSIANEFSTAFFRFGHSMLSPQLLLADDKGPIGAVGLRDAFFNPAFIAENPIAVDYLLKGFTEQRAQEIDSHIVDDVRDFLFGPPGAGGLDLASLNIQRGRDHGLPDYNTLRQAYGLNAVGTFGEITTVAATRQALAGQYDSVDDIDPWIGGLAEDHLPGASVGPTVCLALRDQFIRLRDGDPYFHLNDPDLDPKKIRSIIDLSTLTLANVIRWNTTIKSLPANVFLVSESKVK